MFRAWGLGVLGSGFGEFRAGVEEFCAKRALS